MVGRFCDGQVSAAGDPVSAADRALREVGERLGTRVDAAMEALALHKALEAIWELLNAGNKYLDEQKPWELAKRDHRALERVLGHVCELLRLAGLHLYPFVPATAERMWTQLGLNQPLAEARLVDAGGWGRGEARRMVQGEALFPRVDLSLDQVPPAAASPAGAVETPPEIGLEEFRRVDLRVATILEARVVRGSKKLVELKVSIGSEERTIVAGILLDYPPAGLVGKQIVIVANLKPSKLMGVESRGMLLAATGPDGRIILVAPESPATPGSRVK